MLCCYEELNEILFMQFIFFQKLPLWIKHLFAWVIYVSFTFLVNTFTRPDVTLPQVFFDLLPYCITFYITVWCLGFYKIRGAIWGIASFFIVFIVMGLIGYAYMYIILPLFNIKLYKDPDIRYFFQEAILGYVKYFAFAMLYFYIRQYVTKEKLVHSLQEEKLQLEKQKVQNELENAILKQQELKSQQEKLLFEYAFLRAQINPHFLHNTLNVLFSQALTVSPGLADNILKLSSIMRYSLENLEQENGKVSVQKELEQVQTLIDINNIRFGNSKTIKYSVKGELNGQMVPPLSLITVVENAFKYGDLKDAENPLEIKVLLSPGEMYFYCKNKKRKNEVQFSSMHIGITNLSKRLDIAFKDKYVMKAADEKDFYIFELTLKN
jgi:Histidine kinase